MYVDEFALKVAWETIYWTSFCLTWVVLPTLNSYTNTGEFSFFPKLRSALRMNIVYYLCVAVVAISAVVYIAAYHFEWNLQNLLAFLMATSNAYGLFLVVIFMGQGLIQIPRQLWHHADLKWLLGYQEFLAPKFHENTIDDDAEWDQVVKEVAFCHHNIDHQSNLYKYVQILVSKCPKARTEAFYTSIAPPLISQKYLENLHIRLKRAARSKDKNHALYESLLSLAWYCEDAIDEANQTYVSPSWPAPQISLAITKQELTETCRPVLRRSCDSGRGFWPTASVLSCAGPFPSSSFGARSPFRLKTNQIQKLTFWL